ncbi:MAG: GDSL family lipase [Deltaproteobacteria bacterium]|nr:GDSL family lipase [Deltaproteobacteria bacterium]MBW2395546.1 GDSL family lipase [Deltaproteobacteria bacterium]
MSDATSRPEQPEPFLRGCAWPPRDGVPYPRCDPSPLGLRLPADTRDVASIPVGVRFVFLGEPATLEVDYRTETRDLGFRGTGAGTEFVVFRGTSRIDAAPAQLGEGTVRLRIGEGSEPVSVYLPEGMRPTVLALRPKGAEILPAPPWKRWLCYGDSIAEGWCSAEPAGAWPHIVSRQNQLDVVNLGYAGSARGEVPSAQDIAGLPADLISVAHGTNCWSRTPHSSELFSAGLHAFLDLVRAGHPKTPIVAISPILRADAESVPNVLGASLGDLRAAFEGVVEERQKAGDGQLELVPGRDLVAAERLPDGIHPDDEGHRAIARALAPVLADAFRERKPHE